MAPHRNLAEAQFHRRPFDFLSCACIARLRDFNANRSRSNRLQVPESRHLPFIQWANQLTSIWRVSFDCATPDHQIPPAFPQDVGVTCVREKLRSLWQP